MRILLLVVFVFLRCGPWEAIAQDPKPVQGPSAETPTAQNREKVQLEIRKLTRELEELDRKARVRALSITPTAPDILTALSEPVVVTVLTLLIGGWLFGKLGDRRARKNKRLDEYVSMINNVASDLARMFTPFYQYIRNERKEEYLISLSERIPKLFQRRLPLMVTAEAFFPSSRKNFANDYFDICLDLRTMVEHLWTHLNRMAKGETYNENDIPKPIRDHGVESPLRPRDPPFETFDKCIEGIWVRADDLLTRALREATLSVPSRLYWNRVAKQKLK